MAAGQGKVFRNVLVGAALVMLFGTMIFGGWQHWPSSLRVERALKSGYVYGISILLALWVTWSTWEAIRGQGGRIITQNSDHSYNREDGAEPAGDAFLFRLGGVNVPKLWISTPGNKGTLIALQDAVPPANRMGRNIVVAGVEREILFKEIPPAIRKIVSAKQYPAPYYMVTHGAIVETRGRNFLEQLHAHWLRFAEQNTSEEILKRSMRVGDFANRAMADKLEDVQGRKKRGILELLGPANEEDLNKTPRTEQP